MNSQYWNAFARIALIPFTGKIEIPAHSRSRKVIIAVEIES